MTRRKHHRKAKSTTKAMETPNDSSPTTSSELNFRDSVDCSVQTEYSLPQTRNKLHGIQNLESITRITNFPVVESSWSYAGSIYKKLKDSNSMVHWTFDTAESSIHTILEAASPAIILLEGPINSLDKVVCRSLDIVEQAVPSINLPPEMIYSNTKQYVTDVGTKIAQPVLKRADSMKQIGNTVLASKYTTYAADTLDGALNVAEKYVDKYLPAEDEPATDETENTIDGPTGKAIHTIHHVDRFSRKLRRRLTQRTIAEVEALKQQSAEAVHVLIYVAELVATDPVLAFQKGKELWASLSKDEPENQARPENVEQLIVLMTRESARRMVHLINFTSGVLSNAPKRLTVTVNSIARKILHVLDSTVKTIHMEDVQRNIGDILKIQGRQLAKALKEVNAYISELLERIQENPSNENPSKSALAIPQIKVQEAKATIKNTIAKSNGTENNS
ncbi:unnamed protein product [Phaedon cochleariae]|uniref:Lipid storage droplets surface-binding protein 1 n=1 Tax=Phaedon cochleariae TaxID=80249 RepID=A0A9P0DSJ0_PHACE|nr:unnamed protein product [Phaedon cochleariae]